MMSNLLVAKLNYLRFGTEKREYFDLEREMPVVVKFSRKPVGLTLKA